MLKQILDEKIKDSSLEELKEKLAYQSTKRLEKSIDKFLETKTIYDWLNSGFYDLVYNAKDFLIKLCTAFEIKENNLQQELINFKNLKIEIEKFEDSYLFINTNFRRKSESIFVLALLENKRRISLYKDERFLFKTIDEILQLISNILIEDYNLNNGKCSIWGNIVNYQLHLFNKIYTFSTNGELLKTKENFDVNIASLRLK